MRKLFLFLLFTSSILGWTAGASTLPENLIWEYWASRLDWGYEFQMKFDGEKEIDGTVWQLFKRILCYGYYQGSDRPQIKTNVEIYLIREENGVYYIRRCPEEFSSEAGELEWYFPEDECVLYDFNRNVGESYDMYTNLGEIMQAEVERVSCIITPDGVKRKVMTIMVKFLEDDNSGPTFDIVEGIGPADYGILPYVQADVVTGSGSSSTMGSFPQLFWPMHLSGVLDENGNVVFEKSMLSSTPQIETDDLDQDAKYYDLTGREVRSPEAGGVYIRRTGAKTEKVIL